MMPVLQRVPFIHIPRTGGTTIKKVFADELLIAGHKQFDRVRAQYEHSASAATWKDVHKFTMIRNPWGRYLSLYSYRCGHDSTREFTKERFNRWLRGTATNMTAGEVLAKHVDELDYIGKFEDYEASLYQISSNLAEYLQREVQFATPIEKHNAGTHEYTDWRPYYTDGSAKIVAEFGAWEIERYDYGFDDYADGGA